MKELKCENGYEDILKSSRYCYKFYSDTKFTPMFAKSECDGSGSLVTFESEEMLRKIKAASLKRGHLEQVWVGYRKYPGTQVFSSYYPITG